MPPQASFLRSKLLNSLAAIALSAALFFTALHGPRVKTPTNDGLLFLVPIIKIVIGWAALAAAGGASACEFGYDKACEFMGGYERTLVGIGIAICDAFQYKDCYDRPQEEFDHDLWSFTSTKLQNRIDRYAPLALGNYPYTHNSYNSLAYAEGFRYQFWNQRYSVTAQLDLGARMLEYDLWHCAGDVRLSHGLGSCPLPTPADRTLKEGLDEIEAWFNAEPTRKYENVVLMYFEDNLSSGKHTTAGNIIDSHDFAARVFTPADFEKLTGIPACENQEDSLWTISKDDVLRAGKNIILVSKDGAFSCGNAYWDYVFPTSFPYGKYGKHEVGNLKAFPACLADEPDLDEAVHKAWNETYPLEKPKISASQVRRLQLCGYNAIGPEPLEFDDVESQIWSWAELYPQKDGKYEFDSTRLDDKCAAQQLFVELPDHEALDSGRFVNRDCGQPKRYSCQNLETREWRVTGTKGAFENGAEACETEFGHLNMVFSVPVNAKENYFLREAGKDAAEYWVNYSAIHGLWEPFERTFEYEVANSEGSAPMGVGAMLSIETGSEEPQDPEINGWPAERIAGVGLVQVRQHYDDELKYVDEDFAEDGTFIPPVTTVYTLKPMYEGEPVIELHASPNFEAIVEQYPEAVPSDPAFFECARRETQITSLSFTIGEDGTSIDVVDIQGGYTSEGKLELDPQYLPHEFRYVCNDFRKETKSLSTATGAYVPLTGRLTIDHVQPGGAKIELQNVRADKPYWQNQQGGYSSRSMVDAYAGGNGVITVSDEEGTELCSLVSHCSAYVDNGESVTVRAVPGHLSELVGWSGPCEGSIDPVCTFVPSESGTLTAHFGNPDSIVLSGRTQILTEDGYYVATNERRNEREDEILTGDRTEAGPWEQFELVASPEQGTVALRAHTGNYVAAMSGVYMYRLQGWADAIGPWETFELHPLSNGRYAFYSVAREAYVAPDGTGAILRAQPGNAPHGFHFESLP